MPEFVNLYDAKAQLSRLIDRATAGEDVVIARASQPPVRLMPVDEMRPRVTLPPCLTFQQWRAYLGATRT